MPIRASTSTPAAVPEASPASRPNRASRPRGDLNERSRAAAEADPSLRELVRAATPRLEGKKVLFIGDSHSVGAFGERLDLLLRASGASTRSYSMAGSSPSWWVSGRTGASGKAIREKTEVVDDGKPWNTPRPTPVLAALLGDERPDVLVVAMGVNFRHGRVGVREREVAIITEQARAAGVKLIWVGPPRSRDDNADASKLVTFNQWLKGAVGDSGTFLPSLPHTPTYAGGDGLHYTGADGTPRAHRWAAGIFSELARAVP